MADKNNTENTELSRLLADLKKSFVADIPHRLDEMESLILSMEQNLNYTENYESLYRHTHSLKGSAGSYGIHIITSICHAMEDVLNEVGNDTEFFKRYGIDYWLNYIDLIRDVLNDINKGDGQLSKYEDRLKKIQSIKPGGKSYQIHCLVVTSSIIYSNLLLSTFGEENIKFSFCHDGYEALGRLLTESFDLVVSDYEIPLLNGQALFGCLRLSASTNKNIRTILLTSKKIDKTSRFTDPDFVIRKDKSFSDNLAATIRQISRDL